MDIGEIFENFGLGLGIVISIIILIIVISTLRYVLPIFIGLIGYIFGIIFIIAAIGLVIYLIGKFAKDFIK
ncbi:hypothetical protein [Methanobrevibacter sp.]|uniref:hypothetical protein n=1 Tax=Methanobrevibacter sp. TaxID=66852 RepID=UPI0038634DBF